MITLLNMIFANPLAYLVFPNMVNTYNTGTMEKAVYTGHIVITDSSGNTHNFTNTSTIDFTPISGLVTIDNVTDRGSVRLGRWLIPQSIVITNDITITVTPKQHTLLEQWIPGIDTASLYTVISANANEEHTGTKEDPIPYVLNMILEKDKYYTQDGVLYICIQSTLTGYPNDLKDLVSIVQKVEE